MSPGTHRKFRILLVAMILLYLGQGLFYSRTLLSSEDEDSYLAIGDLAVRGRISLFQDEMTGQRLPIPFYVLGVSQVVFGPNLWAGRLLSVGLGLTVLLLTVGIGRRIHGPQAGLLAGFLLASQGAIVGYYATAAYHALSALILVAAIWTLLHRDLAWRAPLAMAIGSLFTVSRTTMVPAVPFLLCWAWIAARSRLQRVVVVMVALGPPLIFLLWDPAHLKILAHIPFFGRYVEPLGYRSILYFQSPTAADLPTQLWSMARFGRRYESWMVAAVGTGVVIAMMWRRNIRLASSRLPSGLGAVAGLGLWLLVCHFVMFRLNFKWVIAYFPGFAPTVAVVLGVLIAVLWQRSDLTVAGRRVLAVTLVLACSVSVVSMRIPMLLTPTPLPFRDDPVQQIDRAAKRLAQLVPAGERMFFFGPGMAAHLAGRLPYLQQLMGPGTFASIDGDARTMVRSGVWGRSEIERWVGREAGYAVVNPSYLDAYAVAGRAEGVARIRALLEERFEPIGRIEDAPWSVFEVYRRRGVGTR